MAKKQSAKVITSYSLTNGTTVKVGDTVLIRPPDKKTRPFIGHVEQFQPDGKGARVRIRWYYRPEETQGGRREFHGEKEIFLSDHYDLQNVETIEGKCTVHPFKAYQLLGTVEDDDYFCRFEYKATTGEFKPDNVAVYCVCEMPYNPDDLMVLCDTCEEWYHPKCVKKTVKQVKSMKSFTCNTCHQKRNPQPPKPPPTNKRGSSDASQTLSGTKAKRRR